MSGNRVVSVKTYKTKEEQEKAILKERKRLDKVTAERQAKRKDETRTEMLKGLNTASALSSFLISIPFTSSDRLMEMVSISRRAKGLKLYLNYHHTNYKPAIRSMKLLSLCIRTYGNGMCCWIYEVRIYIDAESFVFVFSHDYT